MAGVPGRLGILGGTCEEITPGVMSLRKPNHPLLVDVSYDGDLDLLENVASLETVRNPT
jgi:hypothetical protein